MHQSICFHLESQPLHFTIFVIGHWEIIHFSSSANQVNVIHLQPNILILLMRLQILQLKNYLISQIFNDTNYPII